MYDTRNDLAAEVRGRMVELLNGRLADAIDLGTQAKQAHWNVKGPNFIALHELFDQVAEHIEDHIDTLAERITALGGTASDVAAPLRWRRAALGHRDQVAAGEHGAHADPGALGHFRLYDQRAWPFGSWICVDTP